MSSVSRSGGRHKRSLCRSTIRQSPGQRSDEAIASPMYRLNHALDPAIITDSLACFGDTVIERCGADKWLGPELRIEFLARHELVMTLDEVREQIEHFWFD